MQIRHHAAAAPAWIGAPDRGQGDDDADSAVAGSVGCMVELDSPAVGVAPGQAAVFYDGDRVLGGGWID